jgi:O-antigen/teichoic acid export membrane protein
MMLGTRAQLLVSQILGQIVPILAIPILTRLVSPEEMGYYQIALSIALIALPFAIFQADVFVPVAHDAGEVRTLLQRAVLTTLTVGLIATTVGALLPSGGRSESAVTTFLLVAVMSLTALTNAILIRKNDIQRLVRRNLIGGALVAIMQTAFALVSPTAISLGAAMLVGRGLSVILLRSKMRYEAHQPRTKMHKDFWTALSGAGANSLGTFASQMPMLLVAPVYGAAAAGYLGLGQRVVGAPTGLIGQSVNQLIIAEAAPIIRSGKPELWASLRHSIWVLIIISLLAALVIALVIPPFTGHIFGVSWAPAGEYIKILALPMCLQLVSIPMVPLMALLRMQKVLLAIQIFRVSGIIFCIIIGSAFSLKMPETVFLVTINWTLAYVAIIVLAIKGMRKFDTQQQRWT